MVLLALRPGDLSPIPPPRLFVHHGAGAHSHVVALREDPRVEVGRNILAHIHLSAVLHLTAVWPIGRPTSYDDSEFEAEKGGHTLV